MVTTICAADRNAKTGFGEPWGKQIPFSPPFAPRFSPISSVLVVRSTVGDYTAVKKDALKLVDHKLKLALKDVDNKTAESVRETWKSISTARLEFVFKPPLGAGRARSNAISRGNIPNLLVWFSIHR
jgi:hypothetical protein